MDIGAILAIIAAIIAGVVAAANGQSVRGELKELQGTVTANKTRLDLLWSIYAEDAIKEARLANMAVKNSPIQITNRWAEIVPPWLDNKIRSQIELISPILSDPYDVALEVMSTNKQALVYIADKNDVKLQALLGVIYLMAGEKNDS